MTSPVFPAGWLAYRVGDVGEVIIGQQKSSSIEGEALPYLRVANVQDGYLNLDDVKSMPFADHAKYLLEPGDIVLCEGQSVAWVGRAALYSGEPAPLRFQNHLIRFRSGPAVLPEYALQVFRAYLRRGVFARQAKATTGIAHLGLARFRSLPFPLPPIDLQHELSVRYAELQLLLDIASTTIASVGSSVEGLLPTAADRIILGESAHTWDTGTTGDSPWPMAAAADIVEGGSPIVYGILKPGPHIPDGVPYIRGQDLQQWHIREDNLQRCAADVAKKYLRSSLRPGDVLLGIIRSTRVAIVPEELAGANITQGTARLRPSARVHGRYLAHWLSSSAAQGWLKNRMRGIDMPGLNLRDVRQLPVPLPPIDMQVEMADQLDALVLRSAELSAAIRSGEELVLSLETALLERLSFGAVASELSAERVADSAWMPAVALPGKVPVSLSEVTSTFQGASTSPVRDHVSYEKGVSVPVAGRQTVTESELVEALEAMGGDASPEQLFLALGLGDGAVDAFYVAVRSLVVAGRVASSTPVGSNPSRLAISA